MTQVRAREIGVRFRFWFENAGRPLLTHPCTLAEALPFLACAGGVCVCVGCLDIACCRRWFEHCSTPCMEDMLCVCLCNTLQELLCQQQRVMQWLGSSSSSQSQHIRDTSAN